MIGTTCSRSALVLVDYQERLMPAIFEGPAVLANVVASSLSAAALRLAFVQYDDRFTLLYVNTMLPRALRPAMIPPYQVIPVTAMRAVRSKFVAPPFDVQFSRA